MKAYRYRYLSIYFCLVITSVENMNLESPEMSQARGPFVFVWRGLIQSLHCLHHIDDTAESCVDIGENGTPERFQHLFGGPGAAFRLV